MSYDREENTEKKVFAAARDCSGCLHPPWHVFPNYAPTSMGWRMGIGEEYRQVWHEEYNALSSREKGLYRKKYRPPLYWFYYYWKRDSMAMFLAIIIAAVCTWPVRIILHWIYRSFSAVKIEIT